MKIEPCKTCKEIPEVGRIDGQPAIGHACIWIDGERTPRSPWWQGSIEEWNKKQKET